MARGLVADSAAGPATTTGTADRAHADLRPIGYHRELAGSAYAYAGRGTVIGTSETAQEAR